MTRLKKYVELVPEIWVSFVFVNFLLLLLRLPIKKHSQIKKQAQYSKLGELGAAEVAIDVLLSHQKCAIVAATTIKILLLMARNDSNTVKIVGHKGIPAILASMQQHTMDATVHEYCFGALRNITLSNLDHCAAITDGEGIRLVVEAARRHISNSLVVQQACAALKNLCACRNLRPRIAHAGAVDLIVEAMEMHTSDVRVQKHASSALLALAEQVKRITEELRGSIEPIEPKTHHGTEDMEKYHGAHEHPDKIESVVEDATFSQSSTAFVPSSSGTFANERIINSIVKKEKKPALNCGQTLTPTHNAIYTQEQMITQRNRSVYSKKQISTLKGSNQSYTHAHTYCLCL